MEEFKEPVQPTPIVTGENATPGTFEHIRGVRCDNMFESLQ